MPVLPPPAAAVYDSLNVIIKMVNSRLNDDITTLLPVSGKILRNSQTYSQQLVNNSWRKMQEHLGEKGYARLLNEVVIYGFPVVASTDPATQCWLSWSGCFDGANFFPAPALPTDFSHPIKVWERWSSQNTQFGDPPMEKILDGLPSTSKTTNIRYWEWRGDALYHPGSMMVEDLRIRYINFLPDFLDVGTVPWFQQPVPIVRIADAFSCFVCAEVTAARGDLALATVFLEEGKAGLGRVFNLDVRADERVNIRRRPRSGRGYGRSWY